MDASSDNDKSWLHKRLSQEYPQISLSVRLSAMTIRLIRALRFSEHLLLTNAEVDESRKEDEILQGEELQGHPEQRVHLNIFIFISFLFPIERSFIF